MNRILFTTALAACACACVSSDQLRRRQYDADYQTAVRSCGHPEAAFQVGYNAGYDGERMHGDWTAMCVPEAQAAAVVAYQQGFEKGANNAPIRVVHAVQPIRAVTTTSSASQCTFDNDCGDGFHCRDHACMGYGLTGDRCVFNEDCTSDHCFGGTCRE
jgi:hypothetical protein